MNRDKITFILVRPNFLGNIGSAARVMKNFGFQQLRLVKPPRNYLDAEARKMAVDAFDVLKGARVADSLSEALADINLAFGTSSCKQRNENPRTLASVATELAQSANSETHIAVVFGDERDGLSKDELALCHELLHIPSQKDFPSLNLAQALGIVAYELAQSAQLQAEPDLKSAWPCDESLPSGAQADEFYQLVQQVMAEASFSRSYNEAKVAAELRSALQRMRPSLREMQLLKGFLLTLRGRLKKD